MNVLEKTVAGDWYDMRLMLDNRIRFAQSMNLTAGELANLAQGLRMAVERGTVELKRKTLLGVFALIDSLQFDTRSFQDLNHHIREVCKITYLVLTQRAFCLGNIAARRTGGESVGGVREIAVKTIFEDVLRRIEKDPGLKSNAAVKNILMQVNIYRREVANMKELAPKIPKEKSAAFTANFRKSFEDITRKIQDHYATLLQTVERSGKQQPVGSGLFRFDLKTVGPFFAAQAQEFTRIRSILSFADKERYKTHDILAQIAQKRDSSLILVEREVKEYERFSFGHGEEIAREFATEVAENLERRVSVPAAEV